MHELSLATSLVEQITVIMGNEGASTLHSITLSVGRFSGVEKEPFEFAFPLAAEGTPAENTRLIIEVTEMKVKCKACGKETVHDIPLAKCGKCGSLDVEIVSGREFKIKSMEVE
ncbi:MAG: hydrogenase maturation nickel metallochaperone HypA [Lentisphaerae bacterium GWF2_50_93]|nr:MAG: hydrogenase maturation nickel metallochaperone HypA [Lentisphaerae bacterium GWF2_50_93]